MLTADLIEKTTCRYRLCDIYGERDSAALFDERARLAAEPGSALTVTLDLRRVRAFEIPMRVVYEHAKRTRDITFKRMVELVIISRSKLLKRLVKTWYGRSHPRRITVYFYDSLNQISTRFPT